MNVEEFFESSKVIVLDDFVCILLYANEDILLINKIINHLLPYKKDFENGKYQIIISSIIFCIKDFSKFCHKYNPKTIETFLYFALNFIDNFYKVLDFNKDTPLVNTKNIRNKLVKNQLFCKYEQIYLTQLNKYVKYKIKDDIEFDDGFDDGFDDDEWDGKDILDENEIDVV